MRTFFFSSRRRHTRYIGDWSSDVCSSDLGKRNRAARRAARFLLPLLFQPMNPEPPPIPPKPPQKPIALALVLAFMPRSEERRVGTAAKSQCIRWGSYQAINVMYTHVRMRT